MLGVGTQLLLLSELGLFSGLVALDSIIIKFDNTNQSNKPERLEYFLNRRNAILSQSLSKLDVKTHT